MNKQDALDLLHKNMQNQNLRRHCYAVGFALVGIYDYFQENNKLEANSPDRETWEVLGIIHDSDYEITKDDWSKHTLLTLEWLDTEGVAKDDPLYKAMQSHNAKRTGLTEPRTQMEWALECCDELTGFIVACALILPSKKIADVDTDMVLRRMKEKAFARAVDRSQIEQCEEKLGIDLKTFVGIVLTSMQKTHEELGL